MQPRPAEPLLEKSRIARCSISRLRLKLQCLLKAPSELENDDCAGLVDGLWKYAYPVWPSGGNSWKLSAIQHSRCHTFGNAIPQHNLNIDHIGELNPISN
ncbi:uncharacterized protein K441DRAFT_50783 [Cenococcum geophilum 1.58]|uniref:uncharacterized protein n=1 Tax=Cenococcum geophilum 1.58 TaxID=794803 RepID=UPI00358DFBC0|nr:hypothetical protein K441DRAFT_50783 [Cenococcum geophilum 1.58]